MIDYGRSYSATWRVFKVNRETWADGELIGNVDSFSLSRDSTSSTIESGDLEVTGEFERDYYRIVMTAEQDGGIERIDVATLLFNVESGVYNYGTAAVKVTGFSVLQPALTTSILTGEYAPAKTDGAQYAAKLLQSAINAPVEVEGSFTLNEHIVHELGSSVIDAVWAVLDAGNFVMHVDGRGIVHIRPKPIEAELTLSNDTSRILLADSGIEFDANDSEIPNRYIVIQGNLVSTAVNDDPTSVVSTVQRGFNVDQVDTSPAPVNGETLGMYARRKLIEASVLKDTKSYNREYAPDVYPFSLVKASIDGMEGDYRVISQSITCGHGITINEKASREIQLWQ